MTLTTHYIPSTTTATHVKQSYHYQGSTTVTTTTAATQPHQHHNHQHHHHQQQQLPSSTQQPQTQTHAAPSSRHSHEPHVNDIIIDNSQLKQYKYQNGNNGAPLNNALSSQYIKQYKKGKFLGKGGFAYVYEIQSLDSLRTYACKIVNKSSLTKPSSKQKLLNEIRIHRQLQHNYIVKFERFFEDKQNVYILLELCSSNTFMELIKKRKRLNEYEVQCYMHQLVDAVSYLHVNHVIHRDLKLGNLFLSSSNSTNMMDIKVGDFGLATKLEYPEERKKTLCGTPNYIAPEILDNGNTEGHSFEVDIWALGVIMYTLLVGSPPFETDSVKTTYRRIRENIYEFPPHINISCHAKQLIQRILHSDPSHRPSLEDIKSDPFFASNPFPKTLPNTILHTPYTPPPAPSSADNINANNENLHVASDVNSNVNQDTGSSNMNIKASVLSPASIPVATTAATTTTTTAAPIITRPTSAHNSPRKRLPLSDRMSANNMLPTIQGSVVSKTVSSASSNTNTVNQQHHRIASEVVATPRNVISAENNNNKNVVSSLPPQTQTQAQSYSLTSKPSQQASSLGAPANSTTKTHTRYSTLTSTKAPLPVVNSTATTAQAKLNLISPPKSATSSTTDDAALPINPPVTSRVQQSLSPSAGQNGNTNSNNGVVCGDDDNDLEDQKQYKQIQEEIERSFIAPSTQSTALSKVNSIPSSSSSSSQSRDAQPTLTPASIWVVQWIDYTNKYGVGYLLSNGNAGMYFNDSTKILLLQNNVDVVYYERTSSSTAAQQQPVGQSYTINQYPLHLQKKITLIKHFRGYLINQATKHPNPHVSNNNHDGDVDELSRQTNHLQLNDNRRSSSSNAVYVKKWLKTKHATFFRLSNRTVQVQFEDATEVVIDPSNNTVTYTDKSNTRTCHPLDTSTSTYHNTTVRTDLTKRMKYTKEILDHLMTGYQY